MFAVRTGLAAVPDCFAVSMSTGPRRRAMSDGLIGVASTRITISSAPGSGVGTEASETSRTPDFLTRDLSCRPVAVFGAILFSCHGGQEILTYPVRAGQQRRSQRQARTLTATRP